MRLRLTIFAALLAIAVAAVPAAAQTTQPDPVPVGTKGDKATRGFSSSLGVFVTAPAEWQRGCCYDSTSGEWWGPRYRPSKDPNIENTARLDWSVTFARGRKSLKTLARRANWAHFPVVASAKLRVPHIVGDRRAGRLAAFSVIAAEPLPGARHLASVAIDLSRHLVGVVTFYLADPAAEDTGAAGTIAIDGTPASQWNREQVEAAFKGVFVEGNLPPKRVAAKAAKNRVKGKVTDAFGDPLSEAKLLLQRKSGRHWKTVRKGTTSARGTYKLRARGAGLYRVVTQVGGTTVRSKRIRAR